MRSIISILCLVGMVPHAIADAPGYVKDPDYMAYIPDPRPSHINVNKLRLDYIGNHNSLTTFEAGCAKTAAKSDCDLPLPATITYGSIYGDEGVNYTVTFDATVPTTVMSGSSTTAMSVAIHKGCKIHDYYMKPTKNGPNGTCSATYTTAFFADGEEPSTTINTYKHTFTGLPVMVLAVTAHQEAFDTAFENRHSTDAAVPRQTGVGIAAGAIAVAAAAFL